MGRICVNTVELLRKGCQMWKEESETEILVEEKKKRSLQHLLFPSLVPRHQIFRARPAALSKNRVWTPSLVKLGRNYTSVVSCCRTNQIAQVK